MIYRHGLKHYGGFTMEKTLELNIDTKPFIEISKDVKIFLDKEGKANIKTKADFEAAGEVRNQIRSYLKKIEDVRAFIKKPILEAGKIVEGAAKEITNPLDVALKAINDGMVKWSNAEEAKIAKANEKLLEKAETTGAPIILKETTKVPGFTKMKKWKADVIDFSKLPDDYKIVNDSKLNDFARATAGTTPVPGVRFYEDIIPTGAIR